MENLGYYNGKFGSLDEMSVPFCDRAHFFGDGVYEATLARNYKIYALCEHIDRFYKSAAALDINIPYTKDEIAIILSELVKKVDSSDQLVYWQVTRGTHIREHTYPENMKGNLWVMIKPSKMKDIYTKVSAIIAPDTRFYHCDIKTLNLIPTVMNAQAALRKKVYETILFREGGRVTECSHSNIHIITKDFVFKTAPADNLILSGIARAHLIKACCELGYKVDETPFGLDEMMNANEVIISSSTAPCMVCDLIDGKCVGGRSQNMIDKLQAWVMNDFFSATD